MNRILPYLTADTLALMLANLSRIDCRHMGLLPDVRALAGVLIAAIGEDAAAGLLAQHEVDLNDIWED